MRIAVSNETILLVIKFKLSGSLRFLSHAEMLKVFQRACVRAGIKIQYSEGFNPRPKLSLPLPRSVGVETDEDLLCLRCSILPPSLKLRRTSDTRYSSILRSRATAKDEMLDTQSDLCTSVKTKLSEQLPEGCELLSVSAAKANASFQPCQATYLITVRQEDINDELKTRIRRLLASESLNFRRKIDTKSSRFKNVDVRPFLKSIEFGSNSGIVVECKISLAGTIRVEEILKLLELDVEKLARPIRRTSVQWQKA